MPSPFSQLTVDEKTLLHLSQFLFSPDEVAPFEATQDGIAEATGISTTHVPRSVQGLRKKGLVDEHKVPVHNSDRRRKVYRPTEEGYRRAQELKARLMGAEIFVREDGGRIRTATLRELHGPTMTVGQLLRIIQNAEAVPVVDLSAASPRPSQPSPTAASLYNRVPQVAEFVGRKGELKDIQNSLRDPRVRLVVVTGIAGIGKTTFVAKALQRAKREQIFWYRLHEWETLRNLGFVMGEFLAQLGKDDFKAYMEGNTEHDVAEAYEIVQGALEGLEAIVVLDDFDKAPRSLVGFIRTFLPHLDRFTGLKLVVVARTAIPFFSEADRLEGRVHEITLEGLAEDDARRLLPAKRDGARLDEVTRVAAGHPLVLKLFANLGPELEAGSAEPFVHAEGLVRFVSEEILANLSVSELRALEGVAVHRYPVPPELLFVSDDIDFDVIDALRRKQLLRSVGGRFVEAVDFVREFVYQRLKPDARREAHAAAAEALAATDLPGATVEIPRHLLAAGRPDAAAAAAATAFDRCLAEGRTEELVALLRDLLETPGLPPEPASAIALLRARLYTHVRDPARAEEWEKRARELKRGRVTGSARP